jgi:hypothetical protein
MAIMDPLLNTGFLWRCLAAYAGIKADDEPPHDDLESATVVDSNDISSDKNQKIDKITSSPGQVVPDSGNKEQHPTETKYIRGDTYYSRLGKLKQRKLVILFLSLR